MPAFFFHFLDGDERVEDDAGIDLASAEQAYLEAVAGIRGMWSELLDQQRDPLRCAFEIADAGGAMLFRVDFAEAMKMRDERLYLPALKAAQLIRSLRDTHRRASVARSELTSSLVDVRRALAESRSLLSRLKAYEGVR